MEEKILLSLPLHSLSKPISIKRNFKEKEDHSCSNKVSFDLNSNAHGPLVQRCDWEDYEYHYGFPRSGNSPYAVNTISLCEKFDEYTSDKKKIQFFSPLS